MINIFEGMKKHFGGKEKLKLQKEQNKVFFVKNDTLANLSHKSINDLAHVFISWYKVRIPDSIFIKKGDSISINKEDVAYKNYVSMSFEELLKRNNIIDLLNCNYRYGSPFENGTLILKIYTTKGLLNNKEDKVCRILVDRSNGKTLGIEGDYLLPNDLKKNYTNYTLEEMLELIKASDIENLNYTSLYDCVSSRKSDIATRNKIIDTVCLELLNSSPENFDYGYFRAFMFLKEINDFLSLDLNYDYLDKLIEKNKLVNMRNEIDNRVRQKK